MLGKLIISLDFELHWGVLDHIAAKKSATYFKNTRSLIPKTLELFKANKISATWATVGFLFAENLKEIQAYFPSRRPAYSNPNLNPYSLFDRKEIGQDEKSDPCHYAPSLIRQILDTPGQELATHTFSHYYCLEPDQNEAAFQQDMQSAMAIAKDKFQVEIRSIVFPRNQFTPNYLDVLRECGISHYRTNPAIWFWEAEASARESQFKKAARLLDHYVPVDKDTSFDNSLEQYQSGLEEVPASRFFRPYIKTLDSGPGQWLKLQRIKKEMTHAAKHGTAYHLWWHPHNLATDPNKNMAALNEIIQHYKLLNEQYGMESKAMCDF